MGIKWNLAQPAAFPDIEGWEAYMGRIDARVAATAEEEASKVPAIEILNEKRLTECQPGLRRPDE